MHFCIGNTYYKQNIILQFKNNNKSWLDQNEIERVDCTCAEIVWSVRFFCRVRFFCSQTM